MKRATARAESNSFIEINNFQHLLRKKATESNSSNNCKNNSNIAIRKQLTLGAAAVTVM